MQQRSFLGAFTKGLAIFALRVAVISALVAMALHVIYALGWLMVVALYGRGASDLPLTGWVFAVDANRLLLVWGLFGLLLLVLAVVMIGSFILWLAMLGGWRIPPPFLKAWNVVRQWK